MPTSITITSEFSGSVVAKGATDDLSAQLLRHAGFKQIDDWHGRRHRLPTTTPLADQVAIASHAAEMLRAARYDVTLPPSLDTARLSPPVHALGPTPPAPNFSASRTRFGRPKAGPAFSAQSTTSFTPSTVLWSVSGRRWKRRENRSTTWTRTRMRSLTGSASPRSSSARPSPNSSIPKPSYAASAPLRRATPQHGPSVITVVPLWPLLLRRTKPRSPRRPVPRRRLALRRVTHRAPHPPPLCFSRSCNGAAGLRARYDCVPSVEQMTWGVVSPGPWGAVGDADERPGHRPVRRNAGQYAGGRSA